MRILTSITGIGDQRAWSTPLRELLWEWFARPFHYAAVRRLRTAAQEQDLPALSALLHPGVTVAVTAVHDGQEDTIVARGTRDAAPVLLHGFRGGPDVVVFEQAVNGQAGLAMTGRDGLDALITVDFTGRLVSLVWVRLRPEHSHRGHAYWLAG